MALTPEDVVNKRFQPTKFREGYDQDEVDDFLDEVVVELRRLNQENEELRQRVIASDARISELQRSGGQSSAAAVAAPAPVAAAPEPAPAPVAAPAYSAPAMDANPLDPNNTNNLLQLARRLHEEHVREGVEKRDALIADGQAQAQRIQQESEQQLAARQQEAEQSIAAREQEAEQQFATRQQESEQQLAARQQEIDELIQTRQAEVEAAVLARQTELEQQSRAKLSSLEQERAQLESQVDELRTFEREYRVKLKSYIEGQLRELDDASLASAPVTPPASSSSASENGFPGQTAPTQSVPNYMGFAQN